MRCTGLALLLGLCACTQDFGKFATGSGGDGGSDSASDASSCNVAQSCLANVNACGQSCVTGYNTCSGPCGNNQQCKNQCKNQETTCNTVCVSSCTSCTDAGACAQTTCQGALP